MSREGGSTSAGQSTVSREGGSTRAGQSTVSREGEVQEQANQL